VEAGVASALVNLGYDARNVEKAIERSRGAHSGEFEDLLRAALQILGASAMQKSANSGGKE
jgi:Holliday junction resolvasome RuvABC DNA-binding subunit